MKKTLLAIALVAFAFATNAQIFVGGNLGFNTNNGTMTHSNSGTIVATYNNARDNYGWMTPNEFSFYIMPKVGYQLNDKMSAGIIVGYAASTATEDVTYDPRYILDDFTGTSVRTSKAIEFRPFFRYNLMELKSFTVFCEAAIPISLNPAEENAITGDGVYSYYDYEIEEYVYEPRTVNTTIMEYRSTSYGITVTPGLNYKFNDHLTVDLYLNAINLGFMVYNNEYSEDNFQNDFWKSNTTEFGLNVHSLPTTAISFGVNYAF